jgi:hypothetical protein
LPALSPELQQKIRELYERRVRDQVHHFW